MIFKSNLSIPYIFITCLFSAVLRCRKYVSLDDWRTSDVRSEVHQSEKAENGPYGVKQLGMEAVRGLKPREWIRGSPARLAYGGLFLLTH